ncbi:uncharacterized protein CPUR_03122 [Claviceps purpurea 20.1]|uniref:Uncharacterized protein n=1 Tax=Claviceps purpurea (strain 20.1) TaxID=1111077 RepID=M1WDF3_CLAP2|nr:uncharacterized protein CPUR_03122 [Claviceps purpurea 20.1]
MVSTNRKYSTHLHHVIGLLKCTSTMKPNLSSSRVTNLLPTFVFLVI